MLFKILNIIKKSRTVFYLSEFIISFFIVTIYHLISYFCLAVLFVLTFGAFNLIEYDLFFITILPLFFLFIYFFKIIKSNNLIRISYFSIVILYHLFLPMHRFYNHDVDHPLKYEKRSFSGNIFYYIDNYYFK
jgi:hypothetical protein